MKTDVAGPQFNVLSIYKKGRQVEWTRIEGAIRKVETGKYAVIGRSYLFISKCRVGCPSLSTQKMDDDLYAHLFFFIWESDWWSVQQ